MRKRTWDAKTKALIVLEGLKGKPVAEICNEHQISHSQYYQWRNQFLAHAAEACESHQYTRIEPRLEQENAWLKRLVGELTLELKKRRAAGMTRQRSLRVLQRDEGLLPRIQALKAEPPFWGYRRI
jgi:transposase-like protein